MPRRAASCILALALAGCSCSIEDAGEMAESGTADAERGATREGLAKLGEAGQCAHDDSEDDEAARYLLAVTYYRFHVLGGPAALEKDGGEECAWALRALKQSGRESFLELAFREMLWLEERTWASEEVPAWQTLDRLMILCDAMLARVERMPAEVPAGVYNEAPRALVEAFSRLAALEAARGFAAQAWKRALAAQLPSDAARKRLAAIYRAMAEAWSAMAAAPDVSDAAEAEFAAQATRCTALAERTALLIDPADLDHEVPREMLFLTADGHLKDGRTCAMVALQEKQSGNRPRARGYLLSAMAHFELAIVLGVGEGAVRKSMLQYMEEVLLTLWELAR